MLMSRAINEKVTEFQDRAGETTNLSIRVGVNTGDFLVQPTFQNPEIGVTSGQTHYRERMGETNLRIASPSFFQVNTLQAENLIDMVRSQLDLRSHHVLVDAYAGVGVFAILLVHGSLDAPSQLKNLLPLSQTGNPMLPAFRTWSLSS